MADTDTETLPNGTGPLSAEEEERLKQRPADIDADVREMERRKRVEALMSSKLFREELERVLDQQMHEGNDAPLLQRIREMVGGRLHTGSLRGPSCVLPINDIRGIEGVGYEKGEKILRCKLAAVYRLVDLFGWTQTGNSGQITARLNTAVEQVLTTPRGLLPHEVTASSLVKVDMQGVVQDPGTTNFPVNVEGFSLHASVHAARPDVRCVLHVRSPAALAVSSMRRGLLPLCHEAALLGEVAYHRVPYGVLDNEERDKLVRALGPHAKVLVLSSAGALCCGATLEEAFQQARLLTAACDVQLRLAALPLDELTLIDDETRQKIYEASRKPPSDSNKWRVGGEEFEALMRMLDNAGFRTGYIYRNPLIKNDVPKPKNDVEVPPAVSSLGYLLEEEELYKQGLWKKGGKTGERTRWLNSPNVYQKVEVLETGTNDPKKITKWVDANNEEWVQDGSPAHSGTPVKIDTLQFVPKNTNPKEFKALQQQIKENRRADKISAGPQSHILEGVTWDEAAKLVGEDAANTHTGDHVVLMGAASKGIIQRGYQHNATVYSAPYARNPFEQVTDRDIDEYRRVVERKQRTHDYDTDLSESEAISAAQITSPASAPSETEEESRDEHRVLRIETKQVPVRSQPEVVLSDADTTDFLNAERAHVDRTRALNRDPNLLSDDEVFIRSVSSDVSRVTSPMSLMVPRGGRASDRDQNLLSDDEVFVNARSGPISAVVVRAQTTAVQQTVVRGTNEAIRPTEAQTSKKKHEFNRIANFDKVVQIYEKLASPDAKKDPKCKVSLNNRLTTQEIDVEPIDTAGNASSRSSLRSIASLEWDGRCRSEYVFRTRSLPRQRSNNTQHLYRTRSHSGFVNNYVKNPEPMHYHLPRCRSCGTVNNSYVWELTKESLSYKMPNSMYFSVDNIQQKCIDEGNVEPHLVRVKETVLPTLIVAKHESEFVESQEFNEDNYLGDIGNSFSSENQTVIEQVTNNDSDKTVEEVKDNVIHRVEVIPIEETEDINNNTIESTEGEYHSFTDEMDFEEATYESPVKELVEKDIRDYSVPINLYCDDYKKSYNSPRNSPQKFRDNTAKASVLEPILEESKMSDDSNIDKSKESNSESDVNVNDTSVKETDDVSHLMTGSIDDNGNIFVGKDKLHLKHNEDIILQSNLADHTPGESTDYENSNSVIKEVTCISNEDINKHDEVIILQDNPDGEILVDSIEYKKNYSADTKNNDEMQHRLPEVKTKSEPKHVENVDIVRISVFSNTSSALEGTSFNSTVEFEIYEIISDVVLSILNRIDFEGSVDFFNNIAPSNVKTNFEIGENVDTSNVDDRLEVMANKCDLKDTSEVDADLETNVVKNKAKINEIDSKCEESSEYIKEISEESNSKLGITTIVHSILDIDQAEQSTENSSKNTHTPDTSDVSNQETFSIMKIIEELETNVNLNETVLTEVSESENQTFKIIQPILYHVFDRAYGVCSDKNKKCKEKKVKRVVTVVDSEDILATAKSLFDLESIREDIALEHDNSSIPTDARKDNEDKMNDVGDAKSFETCLNDTIQENFETSEVKEDALNNLDEYVIEYDSQEPHDAAMNEDLEFEQQHLQDIINICVELSMNEYFSNTQNIDSTELNDSSHNKTMCDFSASTYDIAENCEENIEQKTEDELLNDTFNLDDREENMNTAFVDSVDSNQNSKIVFECNESPIKKSKNNFIRDGLCETDKSLSSPFIKNAAVISMEQTEHAGGIKFWISFDQNFKEEPKPIARPVKSFDDSLPSFVCVDFEDSKMDSPNDDKRRSGVLENVGVEMDASTVSLEYNTCNSDMLESRVETDGPQKMLIYDNRAVRAKTRRYSSWPPFEDTLFYRIISQFRMSESFDPNDFNEHIVIDE